MIKRVLRAVAAVAVLAASLAWAAEPIRIGSPLILSGHGAFVGNASKNTLEMLAAQINGQGGVNGRALEFLFYDTEAKPDVAVRQVKRLVERDNVTAIVGVSASWEALPVIPIVEKAEVPTIMVASTDQIVDPVRKWVFKTPAGDRLVVARMLSDIQARGLRRIAVVSTQDGYGSGGREEILKQAGAHGIGVAFDDRYGMDDTDITPMLGRIPKTDAQAVVNWSSNRAPVVMTLNYRQLGLGLPLYHGHASLSDGFLKATRDKADGIRIAASKFYGAENLPAGDPQKKVIADYRAAYKAKYGTDANQFGAAAFDAFHIVVAALRTAGTDREKLRAAIEQTRGYVGIGGTFNFSAADHGGLTRDMVVMYEARSAAWELVP